MYRPGHVGIWLLLYAPVAFVLFAADRPALAVLGGAIVFVIEPIPDRDQRMPFLKHRGFSHTIGFAVLVGAILGALGWFIGDRAFVLIGELLTGNGYSEIGSDVVSSRSAVDESFFAVFGFGAGAFAILAHLVGDVLTPMGIRPFWPLSSRSFSLSLTSAKNPVANGLLLLGGAAAAVGVFWLSFQGGIPP